MHLYQYLPGKFKANSAPPQKLDAMDMRTAATKSSNLTPKQRNLSVKPRSPTTPKKAAKSDSFRSGSQKPDTSKKSNLLKNALPTNVGQGFSDDTVVSDVTTPTTLTYPKIGPGYSDTISVTSDLTIPTVVPGEAQSEVMQPAPVKSFLDVTWPDVQAKSAPRHGRKQVSFTDGTKEAKHTKPIHHHRSAPSSLKKELAYPARRRQSSSHDSDLELENRLDRLRVKSIEGIGGGGSSPKMSSSRKGSIANSCPARLNLAENDEPTSPSPKPTSKKMEDVLWNTMQLLMENQFSEDFDEKKAEPARRCRSISPTSKMKQTDRARHKHRAYIAAHDGY